MTAFDRIDNTTGRSKLVSAIYQPTSVDEVVDIVRSARLSRVPLYPVSKGFNWGYGSRSPVVDNCALVDLGKMNRILNAEDISPVNPIAVIEPGVTQIQLYEFLQKHCPELTFNVTGSGRETSIVGNALDRGVGYLGPRRDDLFGLEIVLGTGEILRTGFRRLGDSSRLAHSHPFGLGPLVDGLFFQGNFGIVTSACFRLFPKRPKEVAVSFALREASDLPQFINELARLKREGLLTSVTHVANRARTQATLSFGITRYLENECGLSPDVAIRETDQALNVVVTDEWTSLASVAGNQGQVKAAIAEIRKRMRGLARIRIVTEERLHLGYKLAHQFRFISSARASAAAISAMRPLHKLALGTPTDVAIENLLWKFGHRTNWAEELDQSRCGLLFVNPALPLDGEFVAQAVERMKSIAADHGHLLYITLNVETGTSLVAIINLLFDRGSAEEVERAHRCADALLAYLRSEQLEPYRARADMMSKIVEADPGYWGQIRALKQVFDPDNIVAPGRYNLC